MIIKKTFKFRLRPTKDQCDLLLQFAGSCRWIYNRGLNQRSTLWKEEKKSISLYDQNNELVALKKGSETSWLKDVHSQILQQSLRDLSLAFEHFFRRTKKGGAPGYPHFRCKGDRESFRYPQGVSVLGKKVFLPKIGFVKFRKSREVEGEIKQTTVLLEGGDAWYVCFSCEIEQPEVQLEVKDVLGIDLGLEHFATLASNLGIQEIKNPRFFKKDLFKLKYLSRQLSRKKKGSQNRLKAKIKLNKWHAKIRCKRADFLHKLSTTLVKSHDMIVVESLQVQSLLKKAPKYLARAISDAGWRSFLQMLAYKCVEQGKKLEAVGKYFPSTKQCFRCQKKNEVPLHIRKYSCSCGHLMHRDHNAALNLQAAGMTVLKACGATALAGR